MDVLSYGPGRWQRLWIPSEKGDLERTAVFDMQVTIWPTGEIQVTMPLRYFPNRREKKVLQLAIKCWSENIVRQRK